MLVTSLHLVLPGAQLPQMLEVRTQQNTSSLFCRRLVPFRGFDFWGKHEWGSVLIVSSTGWDDPVNPTRTLKNKHFFFFCVCVLTWSIKCPSPAWLSAASASSQPGPASHWPSPPLKGLTGLWLQPLSCPKQTLLRAAIGCRPHNKKKPSLHTSSSIRQVIYPRKSRWKKGVSWIEFGCFFFY